VADLTTLTYVVGVASVASSAFTGASLIYLAKQSRVLARQTEVQIEQSKFSAEQTRILSATSELSFNLDVMVRLDTALTRIAADANTHGQVWNGIDDNQEHQLAGDAVIDVLEMALKACDRLPGFAAKNLNDWDAYVAYVMQSSPMLRNRVLDNPTYWPEINGYAEKARLAVGPGESSTT
jgi:hypothetical protein